MTTRAVIWNTLATGLSLIGGPFVQFKIVGLVGVAEWGVWVAAQAPIMLLSALLVSPLQELAIVSDRDEDVSSATTIALLASIVLTSVIAGPVCWCIERFFPESRVGIYRLASFVLVLGPVSEVVLARSMRRIRFEYVFLRRLLSLSAQLWVGVWAVGLGLGVTAFALSVIAGQLASLLVGVAGAGDLSLLTTSPWSVLRHSRFLGHCSWQSVVRWISNQGDRMVLSYFLKDHALGVYDLARRVAGLATTAYHPPIAQVASAWLSRSAGTFEASVRQCASTWGATCVSASSFVALYVSLSGGALWGALEWYGLEVDSDLIRYVRILVWAGVPASAVALNRAYCGAIMKPWILSRLMIFRAVATSVMLLTLSYHGAYAVCGGFLALAILFTPVNIIVTARALSIAWRELVLPRPMMLLASSGLAVTFSFFI